MKDLYDIQQYLDEIVSKEYYILIIIEDIVKYFKFQIISDIVANDIRSIKLSNYRGDTITIKSKIISHVNQPYCQFNKICLQIYGENDNIWEIFGKCYKSKK